jgi:hypothetical protein
LGRKEWDVGGGKREREEEEYSIRYNMYDMYSVIYNNIII